MDRCVSHQIFFSEHINCWQAYPLSDRLYEHDHINMFISTIWTGFWTVSTNGYQQMSHVHKVKSQQNHIWTLHINTILWTKIQNYEHKKYEHKNWKYQLNILYKMLQSFHRSHISDCEHYHSNSVRLISWIELSTISRTTKQTPKARRLTFKYSRCHREALFSGSKFQLQPQI